MDNRIMNFDEFVRQGQDQAEPAMPVHQEMQPEMPISQPQPIEQPMEEPMVPHMEQPVIEPSQEENGLQMLDEPTA